MGIRRKPESGTFGSPAGAQRTSREENWISSGCHGILRMTSSGFPEDVIVLCGKEKKMLNNTSFAKKLQNDPNKKLKEIK